MAYPIEELQPNSPEDVIMKAIQDTVAQMVSEGIPEEEAVQRAQEMFQKVSSPAMMENNRTSTNYASGEFVRGGSLLGNQGGSNGYQSVPNPRLNNFNPAQYPKGG